MCFQIGKCCRPRLPLCFVGLLMTMVSEHLVFVSFPVSNLVPGSVSSAAPRGLGDHILSLFRRCGARRIQ